MSEQIHSPSTSYFIPGSPPTWSPQGRLHRLSPDKSTLLYSLPRLLPPIASWPVSPPDTIASTLIRSCLSVSPTRIQLWRAGLGPEDGCVHSDQVRCTPGYRGCCSWGEYKVSSPTPPGPLNCLHHSLSARAGTFTAQRQCNNKPRFTELRVYHELLTGYFI